MCASTFTSAAHKGDDLALFYGHARCNENGAIVAIASHKSVAVIDFYEITITSFGVACKCHGTRCSSNDRCAVIVSDIDTFVECASSTGHRIDTSAIRGCNNTLTWPDAWRCTIRISTRTCGVVQLLQCSDVLSPTITQDVSHRVEANQ